MREWKNNLALCLVRRSTSTSVSGHVDRCNVCAFALITLRRQKSNLYLAVISSLVVPFLEPVLICWYYFEAYTLLPCLVLHMHLWDDKQMQRILCKAQYCCCSDILSHLTKCIIDHQRTAAVLWFVWREISCWHFINARAFKSFFIM